jgi:Leucine-rich repeat (LRR) protein
MKQRYIGLFFLLLILQSNSCNQNFKKDPLSVDEIWWNGLNETWKELMLRETHHLGDKISEPILEEILQLKRLSSDHYPIRSLVPITNLRQLESLSAGNTQITDLTPLRNLSQLKAIYLPATPVEDLTPLKNLINLEELYIQQTRVKDISSLKSLENLQVLVLHGSSITSIEPIMQLEKLSILDISSLEIPQAQIDEFKQTHPECEINP